MTDDEMDVLLHDMGARWRADHRHVPTPVVPATRRRRWPVVATAAAVSAAVVVGTAVALAALGTDRTQTAAPLAGTVWRSGGTGTLYLSPDGDLVADDSCTVVGARVVTDHGRLLATDVQVRHRSCTDSVGEPFGDDFAGLLKSSTPRFELNGDRLTIGGGRTLRRFTVDPRATPPTLDVPTIDGARWRLVGVRNPAGRALTVPGNVELRIAGNRLTTSDGCHQVLRDVVVGGRGLNVSQKLTTLVGCARDLDAAAVISGVLAGTVGQQVVGNGLTLSRKGAGTLTYEWVPDDTSATDPAGLVGPRFRLESVDGKPADGPVSVAFAEGMVTVGLGCNVGEGRAVLAQGALRLQRPTASTAASCARSLSSDQQATVDRILFGRTALWTLRDRRLTVRSEGAQVDGLVFAATGRATPAPMSTPSAAAPSGLVGTWRLTRGGSKPVTITFTGSTYTIDGLCAGRTGSYRSADRTIKITPGPQRYCLTTGAAGRVERVFTVAGQVSRRVDGTELTISRDGDTLIFTRG